MTEIGEIRRARELGYVGRAKYIWFPCPICGVLRWMLLSIKGMLCQPCAAQKRAREKTPLTYLGEGTPKIGDTVLAKSLSYADRGIRFFDACPKCGRTRWVRRQSKGSLCIHCIPKCNGNEHHRWSNGRKVKRGYVYVRITKDDSLFVMSHNGWVLEHRLVVAQSIGRPLKANEVVHHINGNKAENRLDNLLLLKERDHNSHLVVKDLQTRIHTLETRVTQIEAENVLLKSMLSEIQDSVTPCDLNLQRYNTLGNCPDKAVEGIVQTLSNEGE